MPDFIRLAVTTALQLIDLTSPSVFPLHGISLHDNELQGISAAALIHTLSSSQSKTLSTRFFRLSTLLSSSLLGTVIMYTPTFLPLISSSAPDPDPFADPEHVDVNSVHAETPLQAPTPQQRSFNPTLVAAAQTLAPVLSALGIGGVRFLKGVIPVLAEWLALPIPIVAAEAGALPDDEGTSPRDTERSSLHATAWSTADVALPLASLSSLSVLFRTCTPRIGGWSTTIIDALGRCWVGCLDIEIQRRDNNVSKDSLFTLKKQLRETAVQLAEVCPGVIEVCMSICDEIYILYFHVQLLNACHLFSFIVTL